ncbi:hypothetical protein Tco_0219023 [Tanacetum coccineum]
MAINGGILNQLMELSREEKADDVRSRLTKEDQDAVFDSLDTLKDYIKNDNAMLVGITKLQEIVKDVIDDKKTNMELMDISDQD